MIHYHGTSPSLEEIGRIRDAAKGRKLMQRCHLIGQSVMLDNGAFRP